MKKTTKARNSYVCHECKMPIAKGDQYAKKSIRLGETGMASYDGTVHHWEPYRTTIEVCVTCAD
jgi:hypothetical protein